MNRLHNEKSAYLRHAADQKINWYPWSEAPFKKAGEEDKPLFLSSGAVWCHWCHVMAKESFYDDEIASLLNEYYVCIKLDRDERPDIDKRYQLALSAMGRGGGWPLSVFLSPDRRPFFGGTYFPPEDRAGVHGFKKILRAVSAMYKEKRDEVSKYSEQLIEMLTPASMSPGEISEAQLDTAVKQVLSDYDDQFGGFGNAPKFPMPGAIEFLIKRYYFTRDEDIGDAVKKTLDFMVCGGFYDQIGGGFHRYSVDREWIVPHFEKMADDNAWLLRNYLSAYSVFGAELYRSVSKGIIGFIFDVLSDPDGGFYTSQDADVTPEDEGGYFTWRDEDFKKVLSGEEYKVLSLHLLHSTGAMHHDRSKMVLFTSMGAKDIAHKLEIETGGVIDIIVRGKKKLLEERNRRETPFIDRAMHTSINGMLISAFLQGFRVMGDVTLKDFAIKSLERILKDHFVNNELFHTTGVKAFLDDYVHIIEALLGVYEVTGSKDYLSLAEELIGICIDKLWDNEEGGFFDTDEDTIGMKIKGLDDSPQPSANSVAIRVLLKLHFTTGKAVYMECAEKSLRIFSGKADEMGLHAGYYYSALDAYFNSVKLEVQVSPASDLGEGVVAVYSPYLQIHYGEDRGHVIPCYKGVCHEPLTNINDLREFVGNTPQKPDQFPGP